MRFGIRIRQLMEEELKKNFEDKDAFFILKYSKVCASDLNILRENLKKSGSQFLVVKNFLLKRIFSQRNLTKELMNFVSGNTAVIFGGDILASSRILDSFMKDHTDIEFKAGILGERILDLNDFKFLSRLFSLEFLKAKLLLQMKSPLISFANTLGGILNKFILVLKAVAAKTQNEN